MSSSHIDAAATVLVIGATSGIGKALAEKFSSIGKKTIITGRRKERLDEISSKAQNISGEEWDLTDLDAVPAKVDEIFKTHSGINTVFLVSGLQRTTDFTKPKELDFQAIDTEITTNFTSFIRVIAAVLPHLERSPQPRLAVVSSQLAIVPNPRTIVYNGTKAAVHMFLMSLRWQLKKAGSPVQIVELYPPSTATELHAKHNQPDLPDDYEEMPLEEYIEETWQALHKGKQDIPAGKAVAPFEKVEVPRFELIEKAMQS